MQSPNTVRLIIKEVEEKTGLSYLDLESAARYLLDCYQGNVGSDVLSIYDTNEAFRGVNVLKSILNAANKKTLTNHYNVTSAIQALCQGYVPQTPLYSFGIVSDIHLQYLTGYTDFQKALAYFEKQGLPFTCVCGDLTLAGTMLNADKYTSEWKGGLADYKDIVGDKKVYAVGGNHECYTATYDPSTGKWSSVDTGLDVSSWRANTGCEPFYTVSAEPTDVVTHNVYDPTVKNGDVFIMLSIKHASAPDLFFTEEDGEDELLWLETVLNSNKNNRCFVFFHEHDNLDKTADPHFSYPYGISESTEQGKAFIALMRSNPNAIWFHGHTHATFYESVPSVATALARGYRSVNVPSLQGPRDFHVDGDFATDAMGSQCYVADVYKNYIILRALELADVQRDGSGIATEIKAYVLSTPIVGGD